MAETLIEEWKRTLNPKASTYVNYPKILSWFLKDIGMSPESFVDLAKREPQKAENIILAYRRRLEMENKAPKTIGLILYVIKSFLKFNGIKNVEISAKGLDGVRRFDYIPTEQEVQLILNCCSLQLRAAASLVAFSGIRPSDVIALKWLNIKDEMIYDSGSRSVEAQKSPLKIVLQQRKTGQFYVTFLCPQGIRSLQSWINYRLSREPSLKLQDNTRIFLFSSTGSFSKSFDHVLRKINLKRPQAFKTCRLYSLRKYF